MFRLHRGRNSVVECQLPKLDVAGSNPVARSDDAEAAPPGGALRVVRS
jgi:hypothetical protein